MSDPVTLSALRGCAASEGIEVLHAQAAETVEGVVQTAQPGGGGGGGPCSAGSADHGQ